MSMNLTKLAKKLANDNRNKKKNTGSSAGFHQNQPESICVFYLLASFCPASWATLWVHFEFFTEALYLFLFPTSFFLKNLLL